MRGWKILDWQARNQTSESVKRRKAAGEGYIAKEAGGNLEKMIRRLVGGTRKTGFQICGGAAKGLVNNIS